MQEECPSESTNPVDEHLLDTLIDRHPELAVRRLCALLDEPDAGETTANRIVPYLDRIGNDYLVREVIEKGMTVENHCIRLIFADHVGVMARRDPNDAYELLRKTCFSDRSAIPDLVRAGLQSVQRDANQETFEFLIAKGLKEMEVETKPGALKRRQQVNRRFRKALEDLEHHSGA